MTLSDIKGMAKSGIAFIVFLEALLIYCIFVMIYQIGHKIYEEIFFKRPAFWARQHSKI